MFRNIPNVYVNLDYFLITIARMTPFQNQLFIYNFKFPNRSSLSVQQFMVINISAKYF